MVIQIISNEHFPFLLYGIGKPMGCGLGKMSPIICINDQFSIHKLTKAASCRGVDSNFIVYCLPNYSHPKPSKVADRTYCSFSDHFPFQTLLSNSTS